MFVRTMLALVAIVLVGATAPPPIRAATLYSPAINPASSGQQFRCAVLNVSTKPVEVVITLVAFGQPLAGPVTRTIEPGRGSDLTKTATGEFTHCVIEVGSRKSVRAHHTLENVLGGGDTAMVLSLPVQ